MSESLIIRGEIDLGVDPTFYRLIVGPDGIPLTQADVAVNGVTLSVLDLSGPTPDVAIASVLTLNPASTYNGFPLMASSTTLQTTGWTKSGDGYNFRHLWPNTNVTGGLRGGHTYRFEYTFQLVNTTTATLGSGFAKAIFDLEVRPAYS